MENLLGIEIIDPKSNLWQNEIGQMDTFLKVFLKTQ